MTPEEFKKTFPKYNHLRGVELQCKMEETYLEAKKRLKTVEVCEGTPCNPTKRTYELLDTVYDENGVLVIAPWHSLRVESFQ